MATPQARGHPSAPCFILLVQAITSARMRSSCFCCSLSSASVACRSTSSSMSSIGASSISRPSPLTPPSPLSPLSPFPPSCIEPLPRSPVPTCTISDRPLPLSCHPRASPPRAPPAPLASPPPRNQERARSVRPARAFSSAISRRRLTRFCDSSSSFA
eukprot:scaffold70118_cov32-Tisochrysis_lutea.AAC.1